MKIGHATAFDKPSHHSQDYLLGIPIVVSETSTIEAFGVISCMSEARVVMALYADAPMSLLAFTEPAKLTGADQRIRPTFNATVSPGTYWIVAVFDRRASIAYDMTDKDARVRYVAHDFHRPLPDLIESPTTYTGQRMSYYVVTE